MAPIQISPSLATLLLLLLPPGLRCVVPLISVENMASMGASDAEGMLWGEVSHSALNPASPSTEPAGAPTASNSTKNATNSFSASVLQPVVESKSYATCDVELGTCSLVPDGPEVTGGSEETFEVPPAPSLDSIDDALCFGSACSQRRGERRRRNRADRAGGAASVEVSEDILESQSLHIPVEYIVEFGGNKKNFMELGRTGFRALGDFPTIIPGDGAGVVKGGRRYYEVRIEQGITFQVGWIRHDDFQGDGFYTGVGDDSASWAFDGARGGIWHYERMTPYGGQWKAGDIIGVGIDVDEGMIWFSINGVSYGPAFRGIRVTQQGFTPAVTVEGDDGKYSTAHFIFDDLKYIPDGYRPVSWLHPSPPKFVSPIYSLPYIMQNIPGAASGIPQHDIDRLSTGHEESTSPSNLPHITPRDYVTYGSVYQVSQKRVAYIPNGKWGGMMSRSLLKPQKFSKRWGYFEARFHIPTSEPSWAPSANMHFSVGVTPQTDLNGDEFVEPGFDDQSFSYNSNGWGYGGERGSSIIEEHGWGSSREIAVGMGFDYKTGDLFLTRDGKYLGVAWKDVPLRAYRAVVTFNGVKDVLFDLKVHHHKAKKAREIFEYFDLNNDEALDRQEYTAFKSTVRNTNMHLRSAVTDVAWASRPGKKGAGVMFTDFLEACWKAKNFDNTVINVEKSVGNAIRQARPLLEHFDRNGDDEINYEEYVEMQGDSKRITKLDPDLKNGYFCSNMADLEWLSACDRFGIRPNGSLDLTRFALGCLQGDADKNLRLNIPAFWEAIQLDLDIRAKKGHASFDHSHIDIDVNNARIVEENSENSPKSEGPRIRINRR
ncbi:hypothetical protein AAMO2058_001759700 [Amorphochlora amoebiformis]